MGEDVQNEHSLGLVIHPGNQPVVVSMDIENSPSAYDVRMREVPQDADEPAHGVFLPARSFHDPSGVAPFARFIMKFTSAFLLLRSLGLISGFSPALTRHVI